MEKKPFDYGTAIGQTFNPITQSDMARAYRSASAELMTQTVMGRIGEALGKSSSPFIQNIGAPFISVRDKLMHKP